MINEKYDGIIQAKAAQKKTGHENVDSATQLVEALAKQL